MNAVHLRRIGPARNMCRFYRLDATAACALGCCSARVASKFARVCEGGRYAVFRQGNRFQLKVTRPAIADKRASIPCYCGAGYCDMVKCGDRQSPRIGNHDLTSSLGARTRGRGLIYLENKIGHARRTRAEQIRLKSAVYWGRGWYAGCNRKGEIRHQLAGEDGRRGFWGGRLGQHRAERAV